jgi:uncharacterized membrane protein YedE/YeeE
VRITISLIAGFLFGLGLVIGGMANPAKVQNFLDVFGTFDPSLAFVMAGAVVVTFLGYRFSFRQPSPICGERFHVPVRLLSWSRHHLTVTHGQRHADLCAGNARWHRFGTVCSA